MAEKPKVSRWAKLAAATPLFTVLPALAEGTGEIFGINDEALIPAALFPVLLVFSQFAQFDDENQFEDTDFFDGYDSRRAGDQGDRPF